MSARVAISWYVGPQPNVRVLRSMKPSWIGTPASIAMRKARTRNLAACALGVMLARLESATRMRWAA